MRCASSCPHLPSHQLRRDGCGSGCRKAGIEPCGACARSWIFAQIFESPAHVSTAAITKENELTMKSFFTGLDKGDAMTRTQGSTVIVGLCVALVASAAWAESSPFVGRWHWNRVQSTLPPGEPWPNDVVSEISRADGDSVTWSVTIVTPDGESHVVTLESGADGESHRISSDTTASVRLIGSGLQTIFQGPSGRSDVQTCTVSADNQKMTCKGVLTDGASHRAGYVDVYDRMLGEGQQ